MKNSHSILLYVVVLAIVYYVKAEDATKNKNNNALVDAIRNNHYKLSEALATGKELTDENIGVIGNLDDSESDENMDKRLDYRYGKRLDYRYGKRLDYRYGKRTPYVGHKYPQHIKLTPQELFEYAQFLNTLPDSDNDGVILNDKRLDYRYGKK